jgi:hypothetical protein
MTLKPTGTAWNGKHHSLKTEKSSHEQIKNQNNAHQFFFLILMG